MKIPRKFILFTAVLIIFTACKKDNNNENMIDPNLAEDIMIFPDSHPLNTDISNSPTDVNSDAILQNIGLDIGLFPDFGSGEWDGKPIGIPYIAVNGEQELIDIIYVDYGEESDPGPFPIPLSAPQEGNGEGDSHVIAVDIDNGMLYELFNAHPKSNNWEASSGAKFNLKTEDYRPAGWTSADAAGLPIFPCLVRYPETAKGEIDHVIRFTLSRNKIYQGYVHPARHLISGEQEDNLLPMGGRLRLKADFNISGFSETNQIILQAMKTYGIILADAGSSMFISGAPHDQWNNDDLKELKQVKVSDFEVIELGEIF